MPLTGTAKGQGGSGDGNASSEMVIYHAERPLSIFGRKMSTYKKVHRFITFGIANTWINVNLTSPVESQRFLTTALAEVPWEYPFLYLNQSEFDLIPNGSHVVEVRVKIIHRGNRIAFETAASTSGLATLNQIQNICVAEGLNKTGWGNNVFYSAFDSAQPMMATAISAVSYSNYPSRFYGNDNPTIDAIIPTHQIGFKTPLVHYWTLQTSTQQFGGTPPIAENINYFDGKTTINQEVGSFKWKPAISPLKTPLKHIRTGLPRTNPSETLDVHINGNICETFTAGINNTVNNNAGAVGTIPQTDNTISNTFGANDFTIRTPIEKSQYMKQGPWGQYHKPQVQPSVHIGIQAIPALTTTGILTPINAWTDSQADWEIIAEMDVMEYQPTKLPYAGAPNVPAGDVMMRTQISTPDVTSCTFAALYPNTPRRT